MKCQICNKNEGIYHGVHDKEVVLMCPVCSRLEGIPIIKKPTEEQLAKANQRYSVRERMMKISGMDKLNPVSRDHEIAQRHLGKIRIPQKAQEAISLVENYNWNIRIARRRKKLTFKQLSDLSKIPIESLDSFERGILVKDYEKIAYQLEKILEIPILKDHERQIRFIMPKKTEQDVINEVKMKMNPSSEIKIHPERTLEDLELQELQRSVKEQNLRKNFAERNNTIKEIQEGDFPDKKKLQNITLDDLVKAKKEREAKQKEAEKKNSAKYSDLELE